MSRNREQISDNIRRLVAEEISVINVISQAEPEQWIPVFLDNLTDKLTELCLDEIAYGKK